MAANPELLMIYARLALHLLTALSLALYLSERRSRWWPTLIAVIGGGCSLAAFFHGVGGIHSPGPQPHPWLFGVTFAFAAACVYSRGNVARLFTHWHR